MLGIVTPGIQATLQGAPRIGFRHFGIPYSGPADALSMALANRLVENPSFSTTIEITLGGFEAEILKDCAIAVTGACGEIEVDGSNVDAHSSIHLKRGQTLSIATPLQGMRAYLAISGGFQADTLFGSTSTYIPAEFGGHQGRALLPDDELSVGSSKTLTKTMKTPTAFQPVFTNSFALRACVSTESNLLHAASLEALFDADFTAGRQGTRMGISLEGHRLKLTTNGLMKSAPVYPGTIQCPTSGTPIVLLCDAQTTGGYPRIATITRCDRHLLGQVRPRDRIRLLHRSAMSAMNDYRLKQELLQTWLPDFDLY